MTYAIAYCTTDRTHSGFVKSLIDLLWAEGGRGRLVGPPLVEQPGPRIAAGRNKLVRRFLETPAEHLLFLDADMMFPTDIYDRCARHLSLTERPIIGSLYYGWNGAERRAFPLTYRFSEADQLYYAFEPPMQSLVPVDGTGFGCVLIHRKVFEAMRQIHGERTPYEWFADEVLAGNDIGEDFVFFRRAQAMGVPIHVETWTILGHLKERILGHE